MKKSRSIRGMAALVVGALLLPTAANAQTTSFTATGWINGVQCPPMICTNALGQVLVRGSVHSARLQATDARVTGQVFIITDGVFNADGTTTVQGTSYVQVGTWDTAGTNFTPNGGLWQWSWNGVLQADNSVQLKIVGYGSGGTIDGLRIDQTLTRAKAASPVDPTVPYLYTGTIEPPPLNTIEVVDDFNHPFTGTVYTCGTGTCTSGNGQFRADGQFPPTCATRGTFDYSFLLGGFPTGWSVANGTTREWRADLVSLDDNATNMAALTIGAYTASASPGYGFHKGRDFAYLIKWSQNDNYYRVLWCDRVATPLPHTNVVLAVALTREDPNLVITARVLDKADPNKVLFGHSYVDTPGSDPTLTTAQFEALTGMRISVLVPDAVEPPPTFVGVGLGLFQYTDGNQPAPTAAFDHFELRTSEVPPVGIERAVRLSWPASATIDYALEGGPTVQGPWFPVQDQTVPGIQQMTLQASDFMKFFRLIQAP